MSTAAPIMRFSTSRRNHNLKRHRRTDIQLVSERPGGDNDSYACYVSDSNDHLHRGRNGCERMQKLRYHQHHGASPSCHPGVAGRRRSMHRRYEDFNRQRRHRLRLVS
ncbi:UNKNOWN [Stylonychia lemnae]|uniref:Uncharacterized protein n=1 Tax=Stylonychia lemnae TaxID=5949 RepID=A0A078A4P4_STYLE|nr:UNKNOWN [Stylonychia lemnae]|eukprot:CDW77240.1 UNKNOWN [Stylonychia lemnae]